MRIRLLTPCVFILLLAQPASGDYLKASRPTVVHQMHGADSPEVGRLAAGDLADMADPDQVDGYYHVTLDDGTDGWVYRTFVRRVPGSRPGHESAGGGPSGGTTNPPAAAGALDASAYVSTTCPPEGKTQLAQVQLLNRLKNRSVGPPPSGVIETLLDDLVYPGDDRTRWQPDRAIEIVGFVRDVKKGGVETCNCGARVDDDRDTHIELVADPADAETSEPLIVEVTPTWRRFMKATKNVDWSTNALQASIKGKWIKVRGWMLFDSQHTQNAANTNPSGTNIWRATCWEIHPITAMDVVPAPAP